MAYERKPSIRITTPVGVAVYPKLTTPDTKFKPLGEYTCKVRLSGADAEPIIANIEKLQAAFFESEKAELMKGDGKAKAKAKALKLASPCYKPAVNDDGDETGEFEFNFKMNARIVKEGKPDRVMKPDVFDAKGKKLAVVPEIWGGSLVSVAGEASPFHTAIGVGISLRLNAVQIVELRSGSARDAEGYGFGKQEGFEGDDEAEEGSSFPAANDGSGSGDSTDF